MVQDLVTKILYGDLDEIPFAQNFTQEGDREAEIRDMVASYIMFFLCPQLDRPDWFDRV